MKSAKTRYTDAGRYKCLEYLKKESVDLYLCYCGSQECSPHHSYGPTERTEYLLHVIIKGSGKYVVGNTTYHLSSNQAFLICPGISTYYEADGDDPWTYIWVGFSGYKAYTLLNQIGLSHDNLILSSVKNIDELRQYVTGMLNASQLTIAADMQRDAYLNMFLANLMNQAQISSPNFDYSYEVYVDYTTEYIKHNYMNDIKISEVAQEIGINRSYLCKCFNKCLKISPQKYLMNYRMNQAIHLLMESRLSIKEIASNVGYQDALTFSKVFKLIYGISPRGYRDSSETE